jgi:hypothetical protein
MPAPNKLEQLYGGNRVIVGFFTLDFASTLTAVRSAGLSLTGMTGARKGDIAIIQPLAVAANQAFSAVVSADDTVTAYFDNFTAGTVDPASQDFVVIVIRTSK